MSKPICIVGTDTEIGKTYTTCQVLHYLAQHGLKVVATKPIASGKNKTKLGFINEDAYYLSEAANIKLSLDMVNPVCFDEPIAPHIAAALQGFDLNITKIITQTQLYLPKCDYHLIEGVGGIMVPLNLEETYLDLLIKWNYPIILVVGIKLGCLNHARLTYSNLIQAQLNVVGWIANEIEADMPYLQENVDYLSATLKTPLLARIPYQQQLKPSADFFKVFICN